MKKISFLGLALIFLSTFGNTYGQLKVPTVLKQIPASKSTQPSIEEIGAGIKEALSAGLVKSTTSLSAENGFLNNPWVKIPFPPEAEKAEKTLRRLGFNAICDNVVNSLNHAAEDATKEAFPIFRDALKQMSFKDASNLLMSKEKDAATQYFKNLTSSQLAEKFKPIIQASLDKTGATKYWATATTQYNKVPMASKISTDLNEYATRQALTGLFMQIGVEEAKMRENSSYRTSSLLQKVFSYADKSK
jgi:hypothetical protein